jgi:hypothetical protein
MFSSAHGSQCDSEYNYIPGYVIQDESNDTSHEIGTLEAVDSEILADYDAYCLYADEPLASQAGRRERGRGNANTSSGTIRDAGFAGGKTF